MPQHLDWPSELRQRVEHLLRAQAFGLRQGNGGQYATLSRDALPLALFPLCQRPTLKIGWRPSRAGEDERYRLSSLADVPLLLRPTWRRVACVVQKLAVDRQVPAEAAIQTQ